MKIRFDKLLLGYKLNMNIQLINKEKKIKKALKSVLNDHCLLHFKIKFAFVFSDL